MKLLGKSVESWIVFNEIPNVGQNLIVFFHALIESGECV